MQETTVSHFAVLAIVGRDRPTREGAEAAVEPLLAPYDEDGTWFRAAEKDRPESKWDWWVVGGRWTGSLDGYDPYADPKNLVECSICAGTGLRQRILAEEAALSDDEMRAKMAWCGGCNGCKGKGKHVSFRLHPHDGDVQKVADIAADFVPFAVVTPDGRWFDSGSMGWFGMKQEDTMTDVAWADQWRLIRAAHVDQHAVLVDCHV